MLRRWLGPALVGLIGLLVTTALVYGVDGARKRLLTADLKSHLARWNHVIAFSTEKELALATSLVSNFESQTTLDAASFDTLSRHAMSLYPGLEAVFWVPGVQEEQRANYEAAMKQRLPDFNLRHYEASSGYIPAPQKAIYYPITWVVSDKYQNVSGLDMASFNSFSELFKRDEADDDRIMLRYIASMKNLLTNNGRESRLQMLLVAPLKASVQWSDGVAHQGKSYLVFLVEFASILNYFGDLKGSDKLQIIIAMGEGESRQIVLDIAPTSGELMPQYTVNSAFWNRITSKWDISMTPTDDYFAANPNPTKHWVMGIGLSLTVLLVLYLATVQRRALWVQSLVEQRTEELQQANYELDRLSRTDYLTGAANRRYFEECLEVEWSRAIREKTPISLIMIDVDYFKAYNDHFGHLEGDKCLQQVARILTNSLKRPADIIARFGGEEFVVLLPSTDTGVIALAETCRANVENAAISHPISKVSEYLTVSVGVASMIPKEGQRSRMLLKEADIELYQAKAQGRNRVMPNKAGDGSA